MQNRRRIIIERILEDGPFGNVPNNLEEAAGDTAGNSIRVSKYYFNLVIRNKVPIGRKYRTRRNTAHPSWDVKTEAIYFYGNGRIYGLYRIN